MFCRPEGEYYRPDKVSVRVTELACKAGLPGVAPIPTVAKRLGHANPNVTLSIYAHALEADEVAAAKMWNDAMVDVIQANTPKHRRPRKQA